MGDVSAHLSGFKDVDMSDLPFLSLECAKDGLKTLGDTLRILGDT